MDVAVDADLVPGGGDLGGDPRPAGDLLAHEEERRRRACGGERLQRGWGSLGVGPVVERERDAVRAREPAGDAETFGDAGHEGGRSGPRPAGGAGEQRARRASCAALRCRFGGAPRLRARRRRPRGGVRNADRAAVVDRVLVRAPPELSSRAGDGRESEAAEGSVVAADVTRVPSRTRPRRSRASVASSTVSPHVECTSASAAAIHSGMRSVNRSTRTRGSPAKSDAIRP